MKLPFLDDSKWPVLKKPDEERTVNPSPDTQLQEHALDNFMSAIEAHDSSKLCDALQSLITLLQQD